MASLTRTAVADISDGALMARLAGGDRAALGALYQRHARAVGSLLLRLDPDRSREQADDLVQDVFLTLLDTAPRYRDQGALRSWLFGIAVRKARGARRTGWRRGILSRLTGGTVAAGVAAPSSRHDSRIDARDRVGRALATLSPNAREVLILTTVQGLTGTETANVLGISPGAVAVRAHRARASMADALDRLDSQEERR